MIANGDGDRGWIDRESRISRCKLVYARWINSKALLYSTREYSQYPVINHNGKEYEKEYAYVCITESYIPETNTTV